MTGQEAINILAFLVAFLGVPAIVVTVGNALENYAEHHAMRMGRKDPSNTEVTTRD